MPSLSSPALSCRTCTFYTKCFGPQANAGPPPTEVLAGDVRSKLIEVRGVRTHVLYSGSEGRPVVFLHGAGARAQRWQYNLESAARLGFRALAPDLPGHGLTSKSEAFDYSIRGYSRFLGDLLNSVGGEAAVLVGASFGGAVAARFTIDHPDRVASLILVSSPTVVEVGPDVRQRLSRIALFPSRQAAVERLRRTFLSPLLVSDTFADEEFRAHSSPGARSALEKLACSIAQHLDDVTLSGPLASFGASHPILLVWGAQDRILPPEVGEASARALGRSARLAVVADCGHAVAFERPALFNRIVGDFLGGNLGRVIDGVDFAPLA